MTDTLKFEIGERVKIKPCNCAYPTNEDTGIVVDIYPTIPDLKHLFRVYLVAHDTKIKRWHTLSCLTKL